MLDNRDFAHYLHIRRCRFGVILAARPAWPAAGCGLSRPELAAEGEPGRYLRVPASGSGDPIYMDGVRVFSAAVRRMTTALKRACESHQLTVADLDLIIAHQANQRILDAIGHRLKLLDAIAAKGSCECSHLRRPFSVCWMANAVQRSTPARRGCPFATGFPSGHQLPASGWQKGVSGGAGWCAEWMAVGWVASPESSCLLIRVAGSDSNRTGDKASTSRYGMLMFWFAQIYLWLPGRIVAAALLVALGIALSTQGWTGWRNFPTPTWPQMRSAWGWAGCSHPAHAHPLTFAGSLLCAG